MIAGLQIARTGDIATCHALRRAVFVVEQGVSVQEDVDGRDAQAVHLLARHNDQSIGCARLLQTGATGKIGRVCVLPAWRGRGIGAALIRAALADFDARGTVKTARLGAQTHAIGFYHALGFVLDGPEYMDAGIAHRDMVRPVR